MTDINKLADFCLQVLRDYANSASTMVRGTSDISPLEEYLLLRLYHNRESKSIEDFKKSIISVESFAKMHNTKRQTIYQQIKNGLLKCHEIDGKKFLNINESLKLKKRSKNANKEN